MSVYIQMPMEKLKNFYGDNGESWIRTNVNKKLIDLQSTAINHSAISPYGFLDLTKDRNKSISPSKIASVDRFISKLSTFL